MQFKQFKNILCVTSNIYFDDNECFCGKPYVSLIADCFNNQIQIAIHDKDDFDIGLIYIPQENQFELVTHELINWMIDHESGQSRYTKLLQPLEFFPDCDCQRKEY